MGNYCAGTSEACANYMTSQGYALEACTGTKYCSAQLYNDNCNDYWRTCSYASGDYLDFCNHDILNSNLCFPSNTYVNCKPGLSCLETKITSDCIQKRCNFVPVNRTGRFGHAVSLNDGFLVVGAPNSGSVYIFKSLNSEIEHVNHIDQNAIQAEYGESAPNLGKNVKTSAGKSLLSSDNANYLVSNEFLPTTAPTPAPTSKPTAAPTRRVVGFYGLCYAKPLPESRTDCLDKYTKCGDDFCEFECADGSECTMANPLEYDVESCGFVWPSFNFKICVPEASPESGDEGSICTTTLDCNYPLICTNTHKKNELRCQKPNFNIL